MNVNDRYTDLISKRKKKLLILIKLTLIPIAVAFLLLSVVLVADMVGLNNKKITIEAGESLPSAASVSGQSDAKYYYDDSVIDVTKAGEYKITIAYGKDKYMSVKLTVVDTTAPVGEVKALSLHHSATKIPAATDFFGEIYDASAYEARFVDSPNINGIGEYAIKILLADEHGNEKLHTTTLSVINDTEAPKIYAPQKIVGYVGEGIAFRADVTVVDNCFGATLTVDDSKVDKDKAGEYLVSYIATDAAGNKSEALVILVMHDKRVSAEELNAVIAEIAKNQGMSKSLSKEELCKRIYAYVNDPEASASGARYQYVGFSNDPSRSDWRKEAYLTIQNGQGDCYSYFALSKAFFEYFEIENLDIERSAGLTSDTHFWNMVNIGTSQKPRWYFFDATRYAGKFTVGGDNGCLLTKAQLDGYKASNSKYDGVYYAFDEAKYPAAETNIINDKYSFK